MNRQIMLISLLLFGFVRFGFAQQNDYSAIDEPFVQMAKTELITALSPPKGSLYLFASENKLTGSYTYDLTIWKKGEMATVYVVSSDGGSIRMQNILKDRLKSFRFSFKMPKGKSYKFQYTLHFS